MKKIIILATTLFIASCSLDTYSPEGISKESLVEQKIIIMSNYDNYLETKQNIETNENISLQEKQVLGFDAYDQKRIVAHGIISFEKDFNLFDESFIDEEIINATNDIFSIKGDVF